MEESRLCHLLWMIASLPPGSVQLHRLLERFGSPEQVFLATEEELQASGLLQDREIAALAQNRDLRIVEKVFRRCEESGLWMMTMEDADYPHRLREIDNPPLLLFGKGVRLPDDAAVQISVVGTRRMTVYGSRTAKTIAHDLAACGGRIVSGMAEGIDACAHRGALEADAPTVAVLAGGADVIYPYTNTSLYWDIAETGCVLSEFLPGTRALRHHFQIRNRLLAGMSDGVLVVQSPKKSGSMITVKWALAYNREVFAVPGDADVQQNAGTNELIRDGAKLTTGALDILEEFGPVAEAAAHRLAGDAAPAPPDAAEPNPPPDDTAAQIIRLLVGRDMDASALAAETGLSLGDLIYQLTELQIQGIITEKPGGIYAVSRGYTI